MRLQIAEPPLFMQFKYYFKVVLKPYISGWFR